MVDNGNSKIQRLFHIFSQLRILQMEKQNNYQEQFRSTHEKENSSLDNKIKTILDITVAF